MKHDIPFKLLVFRWDNEEMGDIVLAYEKTPLLNLVFTDPYIWNFEGLEVNGHGPFVCFGNLNINIADEHVIRHYDSYYRTDEDDEDEDDKKKIKRVLNYFYNTPENLYDLINAFSLSLFSNFQVRRMNSVEALNFSRTGNPFSVEPVEPEEDPQKEHVREESQDLMLPSTSDWIKSLIKE